MKMVVFDWVADESGRLKLKRGDVRNSDELQHYDPQDSVVVVPESLHLADKSCSVLIAQIGSLQFVSGVTSVRVSGFKTLYGCWRAATGLSLPQNSAPAHGRSEIARRVLPRRV